MLARSRAVCVDISESPAVRYSGVVDEPTSTRHGGSGAQQTARAIPGITYPVKCLHPQPSTHLGRIYGLNRVGGLQTRGLISNTRLKWLVSAGPCLRPLLPEPTWLLGLGAKGTPCSHRAATACSSTLDLPMMAMKGLYRTITHQHQHATVNNPTVHRIESTFVPSHRFPDQ